MWLSTKRKRKTESPSSLPASDWKSSLPRFCSTTPREFHPDWTRMQRRRLPGGGGCRPRPRTAAPTEASEPIEGTAIFCLHDDDPGWVQGYFVPRESKKPWGMLGIQEELDGCMGCASGGYRRLTLTVYHRGSRGAHRKDGTDNNNNNNKAGGRETRQGKNSFKIEGVDWTGGDMMTLYHPHYVDSKAERLLTGKKALPILSKYFQGLIQRLQQECDVEEGSLVLDWLPNVAIVTGSMSLTLPTP